MSPQQPQSSIHFPISQQPNQLFHGNSIIGDNDELPPIQHQNQPSLSISNESPLFAFPQPSQNIFSPMSSFATGQHQIQGEPMEFVPNSHSNHFFPPHPDFTQQQLISQPNQETMGMNYGRDIGKLITQLINSNRKRIMVIFDKFT